ncbi:subtilisin-like protein [Auriculariales sp. MPI-PUGE-AT-0066]|nr:subtilisin-like protein [Auriculariales sp. MPI-PUGE-AT-0066]
MHYTTTTTSLLLFVLSVCAAPAPPMHSWSKRVLHTARTRPGKGFEILPFAEQVKDNEPLTMAIRLTQGNPAGLDSALADVSDPNSPNYGKWLSREQIAAFTKPSSETLAAVTKWLGTHNVTAQASELPEYLTFTVTFGQANTLLEAKYSAFLHAPTKVKIIGTESYTLPEAMEPHIRTIYPGTTLLHPGALPISGVRAFQSQAKADNSDLIHVLVARANATLELTPDQIFALWDAVKQRQQVNRRMALPQEKSTNYIPDWDVRSLNATNATVPVQARRRDMALPVVKRQEDPSEVLRKVNETLGGTLPGDTRIVQVPQNGDLTGLGLDPSLEEIIRGIMNGQGGTAAPVPVPTQAPPSSSEPVSTVTSTTTVTPSEPSSESETETSTSTPDAPSTESAPPTTTDPATPTESSTTIPGNPTSVPIPKPTQGKTDNSCNNEITPKCLQQLYNLPDGKDGTGAVGIAVTGYIDQFGQTDDLKQFLQQFRKDVDANTGFKTVSIAGGENPQGNDVAGVEANLDLQYTIGVSPGVPVQFVTVGKSGTGNGFLDTITSMIAAETVPEVVTTSYGQGEVDIDKDTAEAMCDAYKQLTARGVSILFASGDSGVGDAEGDCSTDGIFQPTFPSGCAFVTSVGSTDGIPERAASFSSGGFSALYPAPTYQQAHIKKYLDAHPGLNTGKFNPQGRAFPDVSVQGTKFSVIHAGKPTLVQGTSASSPVFASMIALINAERGKTNRPPMGFLNPWLYGIASAAFVDVTQGSNPNCGTEGFPAAAGWDPVTGLGTPDFKALRAAAGLQ